MYTPPTLSDLLQLRASDMPKRGFTFTRDLTVADTLTYAELDRTARSIAAALAGAGARRGSPVLLLFAPGLEQVKALFGCFLAGAVAVPAYPPNPARMNGTFARLRSIVQGCSPTIVVGLSDICAEAATICAHIPSLQAATWIAIDTIPDGAGAWQPPDVVADDLAIIQYTSGSTGDPRGVMITHGNVLHNQHLIAEAFQSRVAEDVIVSWLPVYHDMGLIGSTIHPVYLGCDCVMMSPLEFLQSPYRWLAAIARHGGTVAGAPNFAYDLCAQKVSDEQLATLDLSSWRLAFCGAEPVRRQTLDRFAERFRPSGFRRSSLLPCYGLAEATLIVSGTLRTDGFVAVPAEAVGKWDEILSRPADGARSLVGCGRIVGGQDVRIVADGRPCPPGEVGEIWVRGDSVGRGYFRDPALSREIFGATLADGTGPFLRTGDLGRLADDGELFVMGRLKDVLIIRGVNHYPQDIERSAEAAAPDARPGCSVAFTVDGPAGEEAAVLLECDSRARRRGIDWAAMTDAVRTRIAVDQDLSVRVVLFVAAGEVPKTSSGKLRRNETRRMVLAGEFEVLHRSEIGEAEPFVVQPTDYSAEQLAEFIAAWLSRTLGREVGIDTPFDNIGLDSLEMVLLVDALGKELGQELSAVLVLDFPTIRLLAGHLASESGVSAEDRSDEDTPRDDGRSGVARTIAERPISDDIPAQTR